MTLIDIPGQYLYYCFFQWFFELAAFGGGSFAWLLFNTFVNKKRLPHKEQTPYLGLSVY
jgi:hypothetical protein